MQLESRKLQLAKSNTIFQNDAFFPDKQKTPDLVHILFFNSYVYFFSDSSQLEKKSGYPRDRNMKRSLAILESSSVGAEKCLSACILQNFVFETCFENESGKKIGWGDAVVRYSIEDIAACCNPKGHRALLRIPSA